MHVNNTKDCHNSPKYLNVSLSLFPVSILRDHWSGGYLHAWLYLFGHMSQLKVTYPLSQLGSCSIAFKFSGIIDYIDVHIEVKFQSKKTCISKVIVLFVWSPSNQDTSHGWASYTINELAHKWGPATGGIQAVRTALLGYFLAQLVWISQAPATLMQPNALPMHRQGTCEQGNEPSTTWETGNEWCPKTPLQDNG